MGLFAQIPNATKQPKWVFPIYFEEGTDRKDTIYLGYDPFANHPGVKDDTIFGEYWITTDTVGFFAYLYSKSGMPGIDSIMKIAISPQLDFYFNIQFKKCQMAGHYEI